MRPFLRHLIFLCALFPALAAPSAGAEQSIELSSIDFHDVDVYEYTYCNWDNSNMALSGSISIGSKVSNLPATRRRIYFLFDVKKLKAQVVPLDRVVFRLIGNARTLKVPLEIRLHRVTESWKPGRGTYHSGEVEPNAPDGWITWNNQPSWDTDKVWAAATPEMSGAQQTVEWDITELVADWVRGKHPNHGFVLVGKDEGTASYQMVFNSSDTKKPELAPQIVVGAGRAGPPVLTLWGQQKAGWGHAVNAEVTGNRVFLKSGGVITAESGEHEGYAIWSGGSAVVVIRKGQNVAGTPLPRGEYTVLPDLGERLKLARVELTFRENAVPTPVGGDVEISGRQIAGSGHMKNARTESKPVQLTSGGVIVAETADADGYSLWAGGTNPVLVVQPGQTGVGAQLPHGTYTLLPGLKPNQAVATATVHVRETQAALPPDDWDLELKGRQIAGSGHMKNAQTESARVALPRMAVIVSEKGNCDGYSIWSGGPRPVVIVRPGQSGVGTRLPPGTYTVLPGLEPGAATAEMTVRVKMP